MVENANTGEQVEFEIRTPDRLVMISTWTRPGQRAIEHVHPEMEESYEILEGTAAFRIAGRESVAHPGDCVVVPAGTPHLAWNPTEQTVRLRIRMHPPLRWAEFTERLFAGEPAGRLLREYAREIRLVVPEPR